MRRGVELLREQNVLIFDGLLKIALAEAEARAGDADRALAHPRRSAGDVRPHRPSHVRSGTASGARRNPAQARPRQPRACGRSLPDRHRRRKAARHAQLRTARGAFARQALPIDRPPRRSPRRPRARRSKAFRRRPKCRRSPRRRRCSRRSASLPPMEPAILGLDPDAWIIVAVWIIGLGLINATRRRDG